MKTELIFRIKKELTKAGETGNYTNLYPLAYSEDLNTRFLFMNLLLSSNTIDLKRIYNDDITYYYATYDKEGNIVDVMPYEYIVVIADKLFKNL